MPTDTLVVVLVVAAGLVALVWLVRSRKPQTIEPSLPKKTPTPPVVEAKVEEKKEPEPAKAKEEEPAVAAPIETPLAIEAPEPKLPVSTDDVETQEPPKVAEKVEKIEAKEEPKPTEPPKVEEKAEEKKTEPPKVEAPKPAPPAPKPAAPIAKPPVPMAKPAAPTASVAPTAKEITPSSPKIGTAKPLPTPAPTPRAADPVPAKEPEVKQNEATTVAPPAGSEPKMKVEVPKAPPPKIDVPKVETPKPAAAAAPAVPAPAPSETDFSALNASPTPRGADMKAVPAVAAKYLPPSNPETAELEKSDPRHAAARRFARLSVSEIKLYHEDEVKAGRVAKDLWKRLSKDIGLALQSYEQRTDKEVRERFDYLYDELVRQLAEGDAEKLGADAPKPKKAEAKVEAPKVEEKKPEPKPEPAKVEAPKVEEKKPEPKPEPAKVETPKIANGTPAPAPAAAAPATNLAAKYLPPSNPETAELEKSDPRHAAARRFARLSVSEIKLYHEDEVKAGRVAKDLWKRLSKDIGLALQSYEQRTDKEVRERFDYLYDELVRQLAEGDAEKLGPDAPKKKAST